MKKNISQILVLLILLTSLLYGCTSSQETSNKNNNQKADEVSASDSSNVTDISDYNKHASINTLSYAIGLFDKQYKEFKNHNIDIQTGEAIKLIVDATYAVDPIPKEEINYTITVYIDYKQVEFSVGDASTKLKKYISKSKNNTSNKISLSIPTLSLSGSHRLMIVSQVNDYVGEVFPGSICKNIDINISKKTEYEYKDNKSAGTDITSSSAYIDQSQLIINRDFTAETYENEPLHGSCQVLKAKKDKNISLALRFPQKSNGGVLFLTINSEQIPVDDQQYLYFSGMKNPMFKKVTIKTPEKSGEYTLNAYFVHVPWEKTSDLTAVSNSIKLIIE